MTKKEFSYVVISSSGEKLEQIYGVYKDVEGACYGARSALTTLFPKHGDEAKIIRCEIISTEEAKNNLKIQNQKTSSKKQIAKMVIVLYQHNKYHDKL